MTVFAVPGPAFDTVTVNPIWSPVLTGVASAVFVIDRAGQSTVVEAVAFCDEPLVVDAVAVFGYSAQLAKTVVLVTCTVAVAPALRSPKVHCSDWLGAEPLI